MLHGGYFGGYSSYGKPAAKLESRIPRGAEWDGDARFKTRRSGLRLRVGMKVLPLLS